MVHFVFCFFKANFGDMYMKQVVGQHRAKSGLTAMWEQQKIPHALLFVGNDGTGGLPLALAFAQYVFCTNRQDGDSC